MSGKSNPDPDYKKLTDEELILRFQKEDIDAFNEIVFRFKDKIVNFLYRYTGSREESEDIAQDAFLRLYKSKHLYREILGMQKLLLFGFNLYSNHNPFCCSVRG